MIEERRQQVWRRDFNELVRDESGKCSPAKIGAMAGQIIAGMYLIRYWDKVIAAWDVLTILLSVLVAPELFKKLLVMKYGGTPDAPAVTTTATAEVVTTTTKAKKR